MVRLMKKASLIVVAAGLFGFLAWRAGHVPPAPERPPALFAHYMPWFKAEQQPDGSYAWEHWQWFGKGPKHDPDRILENGRRDIASVYYPLIGPYDSRDPDVLEYHFLTARLAGIQGFIADWYGPGTYSDEVFGLMVKAGERYGLRVAICLEEKAFFPGYSSARSREEAQAVMEQHIRHTLDTHAVHPAYLRHQGQPVFFIFNGHQDGTLGPHYFSPEEMKAVVDRFAASPILLVRGQLDTAYLGVARAAYAWVGDGPYREDFYTRSLALRRAGTLGLVAGVASPGFDDSGVHGWGNGPRITDRRGVAEYEDQWNDVLRFQPDWVQIVTWNDFAEGSTIEPAEEYGHRFVDLTEQFAGAWQGRPVQRADNVWPLHLYWLRKMTARLDDEAARAAYRARLDDWVAQLERRHHLLHSLQLRQLERAIERALNQQKGAS
jgi:glycoprotein endo-alpha-1,2-mannosidase